MSLPPKTPPQGPTIHSSTNNNHNNTTTTPLRGSSLTNDENTRRSSSLPPPPPPSTVPVTFEDVANKLMTKFNKSPFPGVSLSSSYPQNIDHQLSKSFNDAASQRQIYSFANAYAQQQRTTNNNTITFCQTTVSYDMIRYVIRRLVVPSNQPQQSTSTPDEEIIARLCEKFISKNNNANNDSQQEQPRMDYLSLLRNTSSQNSLASRLLKNVSAFSSTTTTIDQQHQEMEDAVQFLCQLFFTVTYSDFLNHDDGKSTTTQQEQQHATRIDRLVTLRESLLASPALHSFVWKGYGLALLILLQGGEEKLSKKVQSSKEDEKELSTKTLKLQLDFCSACKDLITFFFGLEQVQQQQQQNNNIFSVRSSPLFFSLIGSALNTKYQNVMCGVMMDILRFEDLLAVKNDGDNDLYSLIVLPTFTNPMISRWWSAVKPTTSTTSLPRSGQQTPVNGGGSANKNATNNSSSSSSAAKNTSPPLNPSAASWNVPPPAFAQPPVITASSSTTTPPTSTTNQQQQQSATSISSASASALSFTVSTTSPATTTTPAATTAANSTANLPSYDYSTSYQNRNQMHYGSNNNGGGGGPAPGHGVTSTPSPSFAPYLDNNSITPQGANFNFVANSANNNNAMIPGLNAQGKNAQAVTDHLVKKFAVDQEENKKKDEKIKALMAKQQQKQEEEEQITSAAAAGVAKKEKEEQEAKLSLEQKQQQQEKEKQEKQFLLLQQQQQEKQNQQNRAPALPSVHRNPEAVLEARYDHLWQETQQGLDSGLFTVEQLCDFAFPAMAECVTLSNRTKQPQPLSQMRGPNVAVSPGTKQTEEDIYLKANFYSSSAMAKPKSCASMSDALMKVLLEDVDTRNLRSKLPAPTAASMMLLPSRAVSATIDDPTMVPTKSNTEDNFFRVMDALAVKKKKIDAFLNAGPSRGKEATVFNTDVPSSAAFAPGYDMVDMFEIMKRVGKKVNNNSNNTNNNDPLQKKKQEQEQEYLVEALQRGVASIYVPPATNANSITTAATASSSRKY